MTRILIAGGGIAGLTTALSLHQIGIDCCVFETVAAPQALGVGINLLPHAVRELTDLGLHDMLAASAIPTADSAIIIITGNVSGRRPEAARPVTTGRNSPSTAAHC